MTRSRASLNVLHCVWCRYSTRIVSQGFFPTTLMEFSTASVPIVVDGDSVLRDSGMVLDGLSKDHEWLCVAPSDTRLQTLSCW